MHYRGSLIIGLTMAAALAGAQVDEALLGGMQWRELGPARGGRSVAVSGVPGKPDEFYMGTCGGGLWKSTNGGQDWHCVSDGFFKTGSVGAIGVSPSNPNVVYVGMGESCIRGNISHGDGIYKSSDGGKTWMHMGLADTQTIAKIRVHPKNADIAYAAVLGHVYGPHGSRGIYKTTDGGLTWMKSLYVDDRSGGIDVSIDITNPETVYAATWEAWRTPYTLNSGGPGSKLWKSVDGGKTWSDLSTNPGLPKGVLGKIGISVSPADPKRVYAAVEALDGGVFRSDDAGATWTLLTDNRNYRQRAWYYTHILADPKEADKAYVLNVGNARTSDGGKTWTGWMAGHSDNHDIWVDPNDTQRMIVANDGGAAVSTDGGRTWTDQDYPTAQFYHVSTDNAIPYRILGAQQDNSTVRLLSRGSLPGSGFGGGRAPTNWTSTAGGESGYVVAKPDNPEIVFGGSYGGYLEMLNHVTGVSRNVNPWPDEPMGHGAIDLVQRIQWTFPILFSPHDPNIMYTCSQFVLKSTNNGQSWKKISPDLTRNDPKTLGAAGGPITKDNTSVEYYATVFTLAESPKRKGVLWAGSDDGLVHVSQDGGRSWKDVRPTGMPEWGLCSMFEASPHDAAKAYLAVDNHENDDHAPYIFRTTDYGKTWDKVVIGIPKNAFVRVVREDPVRPGLLIAGTELGVWVSFNDGQRWQPLQQNLPVVPIHDLCIKSGDLIAATHGRSFWVLDDISPLRDLVDGAKATDPRFFQPADATRARFGGFRGGTADGVKLAYFLPKRVESVKIEIKDSSGQVFFSRDNNPNEPGLQRMSAFLSVPSYRTFQGMILWGGGRGAIAAPPGIYTATLTAGSFTASKSFRWSGDPRTGATDADLKAQFELAIKVRDAVSAANDSVSDIRAIRAKLKTASETAADLKADADALDAKITAIEEALYQTKNRSGQDPLNYPVRLNNKLASLLGVILSGDFRPTDQCYEVFEMLNKQLTKELEALNLLWSKDLDAINAKLKAKQMAPIVRPVRPSTGN